MTIKIIRGGIFSCLLACYLPAIGSAPYVPLQQPGPFTGEAASLQAYRTPEWFRDAKTGMYVYPAASPSFVKVAGVDFGNRPPKSFKASVASAGTGGRIDVRSGSLGGPLIATIEVAQTGGEHVWKTQSVKASAITGQHDLYFVFNAGGHNVRFNVDYWSFEQ